MSPAAGTARRVLLHLEDGRRVPVEPDEILYLEAQGDETEVRTRRRRRLRDVRSLAELRRRANGRDWELRLEPPVNRVIPVAPGDLFACPECGGNGSNSVRTELA